MDRPTNFLEAVEQLLESSLLQDREHQQREWGSQHPQGKVYPSVSDFGRCPRAVWYSLVGAPPTNPPDIQSLANFAVGHAVEDKLASLFEAKELDVKRELHVQLPGPEGYDTTGRADFLIVLPDVSGLVELKTTKQKQVPFLPQDVHKRQLNGYLHAAAQGLIPGLDASEWDSENPSGVLAYFVKDAVRGKKVFYLFGVPYDPELAEADLEVNSLLSRMAQRGSLPPKRPVTYTQKKFPCSYCEFRDGCWGQISPERQRFPL